MGVIAFCIPWRFGIGVVGGGVGSEFGDDGIIRVVLFIIPYSMCL